MSLRDAYDWVTGLLTSETVGLPVHPTPNTGFSVIPPALIIDMPWYAAEERYSPVSSQFTAAFQVLILSGGQQPSDFLTLYADTDRVIAVLTGASVRLDTLQRTNWATSDNKSPQLPAYRIPFTVTLRKT